MIMVIMTKLVIIEMMIIVIMFIHSFIYRNRLIKKAENTEALKLAKNS